MNVLIYTGYHDQPFSESRWRDLGGTGLAHCSVNLAHTFADNGHTVTVSGQVVNERVGKVEYCDTNSLPDNAHYDVVIGIAFIHYIEVLTARGISWGKSIFWVHYDNHYSWLAGEKMADEGRAYFLDDRLTHVVTLSQSHAKRFAHCNPAATRKMRRIGNALNPADWKGLSDKKQKNKFIYCSAPDRGLANLLEIWPRIREIAKDATLTVFVPDDSVAELGEYNSDLPGVTFAGCVPQRQLCEEIKSSEYWLYPSAFPEGYCLNALQMMMGGVNIISTDAGNLKDLLDGRASIVPLTDDQSAVNESLIASFKDIYADKKQRQENIAAASEFAAAQTWQNSYKDWMKVVESPPKEMVKHAILYTYFDDKEKWKERFLSYAARTKEWDLIVDEPFDSCFSFPLFTAEFCRLIREEAEFADSWTTDRHAYYPTTDIVLQVIGLDDMYRDIIKDYLVPMARHMWQLAPDWNNMSAETFLASYTPDRQGHLALHHDGSDITCLVQLSDLDEYEGGGTYFSRQKALVKNPIGYVTVHPGQITHRHGGRAISDGLRYIIVSFLRRLE